MQSIIETNAGRQIVTNENPRDYLMESLSKKIKELGRDPLQVEIAKDKKMPIMFSFVYYFKTFEDALDETHIYMRRKEGIKTQAKVREKYLSYFNKS